MRLAFKIGDTNNITGVQRMAKGIIQEVMEMDSTSEFILLDKNTLGLDIKDFIFPLDEDNSEKYVALQAEMFKCDLIHSYFDPCLDFAYPKCRKVLTIHDLIPLVSKEWHTNWKYWNGWEKRLKKSAECADVITADSECTKQDIIKYFDIREDKIKVLYGACDRDINPNSFYLEESVIKEKYGIKGEYILSVCTLEPRKNLIGLIKAFELYKSREKESDCKLVLTGRVGWLTDDLFEAINKSGCKEDIILTGYVPNEDLSDLYTYALAVAYVSFYEGFGLPILEGLSVGKAVICSETSSMPEVGGDAVEYCNPYDIESIAEAIKKVCENDEYRKLLESKAVVQASKFSYKKSGEEMLKIYRELV